MAKYNVTYSCGHTETIQLYGNIEDRERKIKWLSENGLCPDCYKKQKAAERAVAIEFIKTECGILPTLEGSEKQVAWAEDIRLNWLLEAKQFFKDHGHDFVKVVETYRSLPEDKQLLVLKSDIHEYSARLANSLSNNIAKFFIDNR